MTPPVQTRAEPTNEEMMLLDQMNERATRRELDRLLIEAINRRADPNKVRGHLTRSQLGRLQLRIRGDAEKDSFKQFIAYIGGTEKRKSADDQFRKYFVDGKNLREWLSNLAASPQNIWDEFDWTGWTQPQIGGTPYDFRKELAHVYVVKFISGLCRQLAKGQVGK